jgi:hypothetical protein
VTEQQQDRDAERIIWAAASLQPGTPGHAGRTAALVAQMRRLLSEIREAVRLESVTPGQHDPTAIPPESPTGRLSAPEPSALQQLPPPVVSAADLQRLAEKYAPPGRGH